MVGRKNTFLVPPRCQLIKDASNRAKLSDEARGRIQHLLEVGLPTWLDQSYNEMTWGLGRGVIDASNNDATVGAFRREMIECVEAAAGE